MNQVPAGRTGLLASDRIVVRSGRSNAMVFPAAPARCGAPTGIGPTRAGSGDPMLRAGSSGMARRFRRDVGVRIVGVTSRREQAGACDGAGRARTPWRGARGVTDPVRRRSPASRRARRDGRRRPGARGAMMEEGSSGGEFRGDELGDQRVGSYAGRDDGELCLRHEVADQAVVRRIRRGFRGGVRAMRLGGRAELMRGAWQLVQARSTQRHGRVARDQGGDQEVAHGAGHHDPVRVHFARATSASECFDGPITDADGPRDGNSLKNTPH